MEAQTSTREAWSATLAEHSSSMPCHSLCCQRIAYLLIPSCMTGVSANILTCMPCCKADTQSMYRLQAYAAARMAESVLRGLAGEDGVYECAYVESDVTELPFFASKVCSLFHLLTSLKMLIIVRKSLRTAG